jgi:hypothetical protein
MLGQRPDPEPPAQASRRWAKQLKTHFAPTFPTSPSPEREGGRGGGKGKRESAREIDRQRERSERERACVRVRASERASERERESLSTRAND